MGNWALSRRSRLTSRYHAVELLVVQPAPVDIHHFALDCWLKRGQLTVNLHALFVVEVYPRIRGWSCAQQRDPVSRRRVGDIEPRSFQPLDPAYTLQLAQRQ